jgi:hypothetical protein
VPIRRQIARLSQDQVKAMGKARQSSGRLTMRRTALPLLAKPQFTGLYLTGLSCPGVNFAAGSQAVGHDTQVMY